MNRAQRGKPIELSPIGGWTWQECQRSCAELSGEVMRIRNERNKAINERDALQAALGRAMAALNETEGILVWLGIEATDEDDAGEAIRDARLVLADPLSVAALQKLRVTDGDDD